MRRVVIIGGGISGLSTAWYLRKQARDMDITVLERSNRWGGKVMTEQVDDFTIEAGPDSFLTQKPWALQLAHELGLDDHLLGTNDQQRSVYVLNKGKPIKLPDGIQLIVPTKFMPFALSPLLSLPGKLRMALDLVIPARKGSDDETLANFVRRRLGSEALDKIAEPLMSGIYNAEAERQSLLATFPRFRQIEIQHGSLIRGMLAARAKQAAPADGKKTAAFVSFINGTEQLITALVAQLDADLRLNTEVEAIQPNSDEGYTVRLKEQPALQADTVILTTSSDVTADLLRPFAPHIADQLDTIRYVSSGTISLAYPARDIQRPLNGFGVVVPTSEKRPINAITVSSTKFDHRAPQDHALLRVFFGGSRSPQSMALDDNRLLQMVKDQLRVILGIEADPLFHRIHRWQNAQPQYDVGHLALVDAIENGLPAGLFVTGSAYRGVGLPDCVYQAQQTAQKVMEAWKS